MKLNLIHDPEYYRLEVENRDLKERLYAAEQRLEHAGSRIRFLATEPPEEITLPDGMPDITLRLVASAEAVPYKDQFGWHVVGKWRDKDGTLGVGYFINNVELAYANDKTSLLMMVLQRLARELIT